MKYTYEIIIYMEQCLKNLNAGKKNYCVIAQIRRQGKETHVSALKEVDSCIWDNEFGFIYKPDTNTALLSLERQTICSCACDILTVNKSDHQAINNKCCRPHEPVIFLKQFKNDKNGSRVQMPAMRREEGRGIRYESVSTQTKPI